MHQSPMGYQPSHLISQAKSTQELSFLPRDTTQPNPKKGITFKFLENGQRTQRAELQLRSPGFNQPNTTTKNARLNAIVRRTKRIHYSMILGVRDVKPYHEGFIKISR
jgi:hypothetical protein